MRFVSILLQDLKLLMRDKNSLILLILMPTVLVLILGSVLGSAFAVELDSFDVAYMSNDSTVNKQNFGDVLVEDVLKSDELKKYVKLKKAASKEEGKKLVKEEKAVAFICVPENFTKNTLDGKKTELLVIGDNSKSTKVGIVKQVVKGFNERLRIAQISIDQIEGQAEEYKLNQQKVGQIIQKLTNEEFNGAGYVDIPKEAADSSEPISGMQYYAIAMVVMYAMFTAQTLILSMIEEKKNRTYFRIQASPIRKMEYILGKLSGIVLVMIVQMLILVAITYFIYQLNWGNIGQVLLLTVAYAFAVGAITLLLGFVSDNERIISNLSTPIIFIFSFFGGSFMPKVIMPDFADKVQEVIPNGQALIGYLNIIQGAEFTVVLKSVIKLACIGVLFLLISSVAVSRRGWSNGKVRKNRSASN